MYGLLISFGIFIAILISENLAKRSNVNTDILWEAVPIVILFSVIGARVYHVLDFWELYSKDPTLSLAIWKGGLGILGGLLFGAAMLVVFLSRRKANLLVWFNIISVSVPLAQSVGRMGNFFNDELYGTWPVPFFIMEATLCFLLFIFLYIHYRTTQKHTFGLYMIGYGLIRFILEFSRTDSWYECGISITQAFCLAFVMVGIYILLKIDKVLK